MTQDPSSLSSQELPSDFTEIWRRAIFTATSMFESMLLVVKTVILKLKEQL